MPLFICDECGCIENTSAGRYWDKDMKIWADDNIGKALCSECAPTTYRSGEANDDGGRWHGLFEKRKPTQKEIESGCFINRVEKWK